MSLGDLDKSALCRALRGAREGAVALAPVAAFVVAVVELWKAGRLDDVLYAALFGAVVGAVVCAIGRVIAGRLPGAVVGAVAGVIVGQLVGRALVGSSVETISEVVSQTDPTLKIVTLKEYSPGGTIGYVAGLSIGALLGSLGERILRSRVQPPPTGQSGAEGPSTP